MKFISDDSVKLNGVQLVEANTTDKYTHKEFYMMVEGGYLIFEKEELTLDMLSEAKLYVEMVEDDSKIIVTRHDVIAEFFRKELGIYAKRINYARPYEIKGKDVYGTLPLSFIPECNSLTTILGTLRQNENDIDNLSYSEFKNQVVDVRRYTAQSESVWNGDKNYD